MNQIHPYAEPGSQLFWKIKLTVLCVVAGGLLAYFLFRGF